LFYVRGVASRPCVVVSLFSGVEVVIIGVRRSGTYYINFGVAPQYNMYIESKPFVRPNDSSHDLFPFQRSFNLSTREQEPITLVQYVKGNNMFRTRYIF